MLGQDQILKTLETLVDKAKKAGAHEADAMMGSSRQLSTDVREGKLEHLERSESANIGLRVSINKSQANVSSSDFSEDSLDRLVAQAIEMAKVVPENPYGGLASSDEIAKNFPDLDSFDSYEPTTEELINIARSCEQSARNVEGVTNTDVAAASWGISTSALVTSNGFSGTRKNSAQGFYAVVIAEKNGEKERAYEQSTAVFNSDLASPADIGKKAGELAVKALGGRKVKTGHYPVVFDPRISRGLLGEFASAVNARSIILKNSFLKNSLGKKVFADGVNIVDDPHRKRGFGSRGFDADGLPTKKFSPIENGKLTSWFLDLESARQLKLKSTASASRGLSAGSTPSPSNLYMEAGKISPDDLIADIKEGLYVMDTMGHGANTTTGDYSQGAQGFWIENGKVSYPVSEITMASTLQDMFATLIPASDLEFKFSLNAPTIMIPKMTISGK